jgi:hypothetical protein
MAANILGLRDRLDDEDDIDNLLGILKTQGMTDNDFKAAGLAPVDELWAGRYSAAIDDQEFSELEKAAEKIRNVELANKDWKIDRLMKEGLTRDEAEWQWMGDARERISDETGLDLYSGDLTSGEKEPQFMQEFSDAGAAFRPGGLQTLQERTENNMGTLLGELVQHPKFFSHYPEAQFMPVYAPEGMNEEGTGGYWASELFAPDDRKEEIKDNYPMGYMGLNTDMSEHEMLSTVLHEMQHYIQGVEGWENGGAWGPELTKQYINDQMSYEGQDNIAGDRADWYRSNLDTQEGLFDFQKMDRVANDEGAQMQAYLDLSGEEVARAVEERWKNGEQGTHYFYGSPDKHEEQNWNQEGEGILPLDTIGAARSEMADQGLLGVLDKKTIKALIDSDFEMKGPYVGERDIYVNEMRKRIEGL